MKGEFAEKETLGMGANTNLTSEQPYAAKFSVTKSVGLLRNP